MKRKFITILVLSALCGVVFLHNPGITANTPKEFRAVWVSTVYRLDYPTMATGDPASLTTQADTILQSAKDMGMNAVILQVRPAADAFYPSSIFPWSKYLTGETGQAPDNGFDPLAYWVQKAHTLGLTLHAWINPYRITLSGEEDYTALPTSHPAKLHPDWVLKAEDNNYYFDPAVPDVQQLVVDGALEILQNYDVDGIHLDDYFYPTASFDDSISFLKYGAGYSDIAVWRRDNVTNLMSKLNTALHQQKSSISFGVSPAGIWANASNLPEGSATAGSESYFSHYADTRRWVKEGLIDYICPQIYWEIGHSLADYKVLANWWADVVRGTDTALYIGMADYKAGNTDPQSPWHGIAAIKDQIAVNASIPEITGEVHFRYALLSQNKELSNFYTAYYNQQAIPEESPELPPSESPAPPQTPTPPTSLPDGVTLNKEDHTAYLKGAENSLFLPEGKLKRAEAAAIFARLMVDKLGNSLFLETASYSTAFTDVPASSWYAPYIGFLEQYNVINGYAGNVFLPEGYVTRAEFAAMATRFERIGTNTNSGFSDVNASHWAAPVIAFAAEHGWINGFEDHTFRPDDPITRGQTAAIMNRVLARHPDEEAISSAGIMPYKDTLSHWAHYEIIEASYPHNYRMIDGIEHWQ